MPLIREIGRQTDVKTVLCGGDAYCKNDDIPRPVGTVDNTLFDLFLVDKDKKTVQVMTEAFHVFTALA